jgi:hypothetical protein
MNISTSTFRLQLIVCHSTFLTVLIEKDNQSLQPENTFSRKRFHTQLQKYLLAHRYSKQLRTAFRTRARLVCHLVFFFVSRRAHQKLMFCVRMISRTTSQKIFVQKRDENTKTELVKSIFRSLLGPSVISQKLRRFCMETLFNSMFEIINS